MSNQLTAPFNPPHLFKNPHFQTIYPTFARQRQPFVKWQRLELNDGDFVELTLNGELTPEPLPIVIMLPGLEGSLESHYIKRLLSKISQLNTLAIVLHHRGCAQGPNRLWRSYHSNDQMGLIALVNMLKEQYPQRPLFAVGYSMGANLLANYLSAHSEITKAALISPPFDLALSAQMMNDGARRIYRRYLLESLKQRLINKIDVFANAPLSLADVKAVRSIAQFDELYTAPACGFADANDYYQKASCINKLASIQTPTWLLRAADDPVVDPLPEDFPAKVNPHVYTQITPYGGHVGFCDSLLAKRSWLDKMLIQWFALDAIKGENKNVIKTNKNAV